MKVWSFRGVIYSSFETMFRNISEVYGVYRIGEAVYGIGTLREVDVKSNLCSMNVRLFRDHREPPYIQLTFGGRHFDDDGTVWTSEGRMELVEEEETYELETKGGLGFYRIKSRTAPRRIGKKISLRKLEAHITKKVRLEELRKKFKHRGR